MPDDSTQKIYEYTCGNNYKEFAEIHDDLKFAASLTLFGLLLKGSKYASSGSWNNIERITKLSGKTDDYLRNEFLLIVDNAKKIYTRTNKRKRGKR